MSQKAPTPPISKRSYTLRLTFSSLVTAGIVLFIGFGWAFVLGVMVGRGYNPETKVPQLATLLPAEDRAEGQAAREKLEDTLPKAEVMKPEELRYSTTLKGKPGQNATDPRSRNATAANMAPVVAPQPAPTDGVTRPAATPGTPPSAQAAVSQPKPEKTQPAEQLFDFVFQVATFKDTASVDKLRTRLEGEGLRSRMDKDGKLLKVMVLLRGSNEMGQAVRQQMVDMGLGQPLQRSKNAVKGKKR